MRPLKPLREREGYAAPAALAARRANQPALAAAEETLVGNVRTLRCPGNGIPRARLLHLHGGGFRLGGPENVAGFAAALAQTCGLESFCPAYRLAPEHPYPAALNDVQQVFDSLQTMDSRPLLLSGDSAGGGLATSLTMLSVSLERPPKALMLISPWLDLTVTSDAYAANAATDRLFSRDAAREAADQYLQGVSARDPLVSPLLSSIEGFPPTFLAVGTGEVLADDSRRFAAALRAGKVPCQFLEIPNMEHVAPTRDRTLTGAAETFSQLAGFIDQLLTWTQ